MLVAEKFLNKQIISLDEGRILGVVKDFYVSQNLETVTGLYLGSEGLLSRKPKIIKQNGIYLYGVDVLFVTDSQVLLEGDKLDTVEGLDQWLRRDDLRGRNIQSPTGAEVGKINEVFFDETGQILGFGLQKIKIEGPIAENRAIRREVIINPGDNDNPMTIDLIKAEQQRWFFQGQ
jgi:uncharacterized protein YrrD